MSDMLRWPFRIIMYGLLYIGWVIISLIILAIAPTMNYFAAFNILPVGWILITAVFFTDLYFTQIRVRKRSKPKIEAFGGS
jgi:hypothetical protein